MVGVEDYKNMQQRIQTGFLDSAAFLILNEQIFYLFCQIHTSQTGGQQYSDTSPYCEWSLPYLPNLSVRPKNVLLHRLHGRNASACSRSRRELLLKYFFDIYAGM